MNNRSELQTEYFDLIRILNKTNLMKNQKTEINFLIKVSAANKRYLAATTNGEKYLSFGDLDTDFQLRVDANLKYQNFGLYIKKSISNITNESELKSAIRLAISRLFAVELF